MLLFFAPVLNLAFFLLLSLVPSRRAAADADLMPPALLARIIPDSALGSAALALVVVVVFGVAAVLLSVTAFKVYGWGLFVGLPFAVGLASAVLHGYRQRSYWGCVAVALVSVVFLGPALLALAVEGVVCLWMASSSSRPCPAAARACRAPPGTATACGPPAIGGCGATPSSTAYTWRVLRHIKRLAEA